MSWNRLQQQIHLQLSRVGRRTTKKLIARRLSSRRTVTNQFFSFFALIISSSAVAAADDAFLFSLIATKCDFSLLFIKSNESVWSYCAMIKT